MIDMHIHTTLSDGILTLEETLMEAERLGLKCISITDHNVVDAYELLQDPKIRNLFSGKILKGIEISSFTKNCYVHILGYGFDWEMLKAQIKVPNINDMNDYYREQAQKRFRELNIDIDVSKTESWAECLVIITENMDKLPIDFMFNSPYLDDIMSSLWWKMMTDKNSTLIHGLEKVYPRSSAAIKLIRDCGGKAILAHPEQYYDQADIVLEYLKDKIDGIECFHWSATPEQSKKLADFCKENNLLITGGTDNHGRGRELGALAIPEYVLSQFSDSDFV